MFAWRSTLYWLTDWLALVSELRQETVAPEQWVNSAHQDREAGFDYLDFLSVRELESGSFVVTAHLVNLDAFARAIIEAEWLEAESQNLPSLTSIYPGAHWHELEASELFGISFRDGVAASMAPVVEPFIASQPALRRDFALTARLDQPWPGTNEPGLAWDHPRRKRKRAVPGNPSTWEVMP